MDLDGTLAHYDNWKGPGHIGVPIDRMVVRVKRWLDESRDVRIFTARINVPEPEHTTTVKAIRAWCKKVFGRELEITCMKDMGMIELWDDRAVRVEANTGRTECACGRHVCEHKK